MKFLMLKLLVLVSLSASLSAREVVIYSVYPGDRLEAVFKPFTAATGINVKVVEGKSLDLINKIEAEGEQTQADLHLDKDLVFHGIANRKGLYRAIESEKVFNQVPSHFIESNNKWTTLFYRSRLIMFNTNAVKKSELSTYEDLGSEKWLGRLCMRTSKSNYNQALVAYLVAHFGKEKATQIAKNWVKNTDMPVFTSDRAIISAVAEGKCDVGIANSYYLVPFIEKDPNFPVRLFFPSQDTAKAHINGVGIGVTKYAKNVTEANMVIEYLTSAQVQAPVADAFDQYPVNTQAPLGTILSGFGDFKVDSTNIGVISNLTDIATEVMKEANWQ